MSINDTRCQISGDLKGEILMVNISIPRCRMLIMEKHFMQRIKRSRVAAAVILDDTPRHSWRVSSPYQGSSLYNTLMQNTFSTLFSEEFRSDVVFMVRRDDWIKYDHMLSQAGHTVFISLGSIRCATKNYQKIDSKNLNGFKEYFFYHYLGQNLLRHSLNVLHKM